MLRGARPEDVAAALGLARATAYGWLASYRKGGRQALLSRSVPGRPPTISPAQMRRLWTLIADADPRERQFSSALWTGDLVQELIRREFGICLSAATVRRLLLKMGLPARRPLLRADRPDHVLDCRQASQFPAIRARAEADGATIYFGDVQRVQPDTSRQPGVLTQDPGTGSACPRRRPSPASVIFAVTARIGPCFAAYDGLATAPALDSFCARLLHDVPGRVYLIMADRLGYRERSASDPATLSQDRLRLFFLPPPASAPGYACKRDSALQITGVKGHP